MAYFKASARSVDMLGRQQIAGIPNAINEIFKNAYDAYAKNVRVDYLEENNFLFIRDNGFGMTREDFENKWLTLGTDSKVAEGNNYKPKDGKRYTFGEKGIGRLSIATIGPSVLVVTRANRNDGHIYKIITSFVCWTLFEIPGISIDRIPIPVIETEFVPEEKQVIELIEEVKKFYENLKESNEFIISEELNTHILNSLNINSFSPKQLANQYVSTDNDKKNESLNLENNLSGTHFYITPVDNILSELLKKGSFYSNDLNDLQKQLLGFSPIFLSDYKKEMDTSFWVYRKNELFPERNILGENEFFSTQDYEKGDHHFEGEFDENGHFVGTVSIYGKTMPYEISWRSAHGRKPRCGNFKIKIAYFQGKKEESLLIDNDFAYMREKLNLIGGLYIYKDYVRILPYGDNDFDFLKLEKKRTLSAGNYIFSMRRFIGAILLSGTSNTELREKAGREGFAKNQAYYDFVSILQDFLESVLIDFLREKSTERKTDVYLETKAELTKQYKIQKSEEEKTKKLRNQFLASLEEYYKNLNTQKTSKELSQFLKRIDKELSDNLFDHNQRRIQNLEQLKNDLLNFSRNLENSLFLKKPNISLGSDIYLRYEQYVSEYQDFLENVLFKARDKYLHKIEDALFTEGNKIEQDRNFQKKIDKYKSEIASYLSSNKEQIHIKLDKLHQNVGNWVHSLETEHISQLDGILSKVQRPIKDSKEVSTAINECEIFIQKAKKNIDNFFSYVSDDISDLLIITPDNASTYSAKEVLIAQGESLTELKKQLENEAELFQLGTAISIIHHEFGQTTEALKHAINDLGVWANSNSPLVPLYRQLSASYNHLDNYLKLFTPLSKRRKIKVTDVKGDEILKYVNDVFKDKCSKDSISIEATNRFKETFIHIDISVILPVFINLVDNTTFWLTKIPVERGRKIVFDATDEGDLLIYDNGPGFGSLMENLIFERGFTTKPGGRGLGLFISKQVLNQENFDLKTIPPRAGKGASFIIEKVKENDIDE